MYAGRVVERAAGVDIFDDPQHPYTLGLLGSIPKIDETRDRLLAIEGTVPAPFDLPSGLPFPSALRVLHRGLRDGGSATAPARRRSQRRLHPRTGRGRSLVSVLLEVEDLVRHFSVRSGLVLGKTVGVVRAVDGISFTLNRGETLALVGEFGCGKSTTARLVLRLIDPTSGTIRFEGMDISSLARRTAAQTAPAHADRVPGSVRLAQPAHDGRRDAGRTADRARHRRTHCAPRTGEPSCSVWSASQRTTRNAIRTNSPAGNVNASALRARSRWSRRWWFATNRFPRWTFRSRRRW